MDETTFAELKRSFVDVLVRSGLAGSAGDMTHPCQAHEVAEVMTRAVQPTLAAKDAEIARWKKAWQEADREWAKDQHALKAAESSRRDWAAEAMRLEMAYDEATRLPRGGRARDGHGRRPRGAEEHSPWPPDSLWSGSQAGESA